MKAIESTSEAIQILIAAGTRPSQIDYVSPGDRAREEAAQVYLRALPPETRAEAVRAVNDAVEAYYDDNIQGSDGQMYSASDLNNMF